MNNSNYILPKHWQIKKLGEVCKCVTGTTPPKNDLKNYGEDIPFVKPPQLHDKPIHDAPEKLSKQGVGKARVLPVNSVLVTCIGNLGRTAINKIPVAFNQQINAIIPPANIEGRFLFYQAQSSDFKNQLEGLSAATTVAIVNKGKFETINIVIPPLPEQLAIVSKIEELLSDLENGKQQLLTAQQQLKVYRQSLLKWAFEGKLSEEWRKTQKSLIKSTELLKHIQTEKEKNAKTSGKKLKPLTPITNDERILLPQIPKEWIWVKLGDHAFVTKLAGFEFTKYVKYKDKGDVPVIRAQNVSRYCFIPRNFLYVDREIMERLPRSRVYGGEILMVFVGAGLGNVGIVPNNQEFFLGPNVAKIALEKQFTNKFIFHFLTSKLGFANVTGMSKATAQGSISMANIREVSVPLVSLEEQNFIVEELESKLTVCDKIEETITNGLQQTETLRQSILKRAFEGRLVTKIIEVNENL